MVPERQDEEHFHPIAFLIAPNDVEVRAPGSFSNRVSRPPEAAVEAWSTTGRSDRLNEWADAPVGFGIARNMSPFWIEPHLAANVRGMWIGFRGRRFPSFAPDRDRPSNSRRRGSAIRLIDMNCATFRFLPRPNK